MKALIGRLIRDGYLKTSRIIDAFYRISREDFVPAEIKDEAGINAPLPIGFGQTISQPLTVAFMLELLEPKEGEKILDVGSGSGWQSCLLAHIVGENGKVFAIERISKLSEFGRINAEKYHFKNLEFIVGDGSRGYQKEAPFDKIIVGAAAFGKIPEALKEQIKTGGKLVIPVDRSIWLVEKLGENEYKETEYPGFAFVPLIPKQE